MFNQRLKELRSEKGFEAQYVAEKLNVAKSTYSGYENGKSNPSFEILQAIASLFDVSVDYLLGRTNLRQYSDSIIAFNTLDVEGLDDDEVEALKNIIETMKAKHKK